MDWLLERQNRIENKLAKKHLKGGSLVLFDISSSCYTGQKSSLRQYCYKRHSKCNKKLSPSPAIANRIPRIQCIMSPIIQHMAVPKRDKDARRMKFGPDAISRIETAFQDLAFSRSRLYHSARNDIAVYVAFVRRSLRLPRDASLRMSVGTVKVPRALTPAKF